MRPTSKHAAGALLALTAFAGCGLESVFVNAGHDQYERPASKIVGAAPEGIDVAKISIIDGDGNAVEPFLETDTATGYEMRLPSSRYQMLRVRARDGNMELRALVPGIGEESELPGVDLDARNMAETLIVEARLSADGANMKQITPDAYLGTRNLIRAAFDTPGSAPQQFLTMVERVMAKYDPAVSTIDPFFFNVPVFCRSGTVEPPCTLTPLPGSTYVVKTSALDRGFIAREPFDYVGDGTTRNDSIAFDSKLAEVAEMFRPAGCPDPDRIRALFTVDFRAGGKNGNCGTVDRFKWATDKPGKSMFFVGWIYVAPGRSASDIQDPNVAKLLGNSSPNTVPMYDDGTNGDEKAGDGIWSIMFDLPRSSPGHVLRIGYKYTWGTTGAPWSGSEEWPGNSRILEVVDDNGDEIVYRHDVFGDEATNKDNANSFQGGTGVIDWSTDLQKCGTPTSHENEFDNNSCMCGSVLTPKWIGPLTVTCM